MKSPLHESWRDELREVVDLMRDLSRISDPQEAGRMYGDRVRQRLVPMDEFIAVSRRGLTAPNYRITRSSRWREEINPWQQPDKLPMFSSGLLGELLYSDEPAIIEDLPSRLSKDDPAYDYLRRARLMVTMPQYEDGIALNMNVVLMHDADSLPLERVPTMVWNSNLYGRGTLNLVLRRELAEAYEDLRRAHEAIDHEMRAVGDIQRALLPQTLPSIPGLDLAAYYETSRRAGGDYYDLFDINDHAWGIFIADVSGHSTPAAVVMAITHAVAHLHPTRGAPPGEMLNFVNRTLAERYAPSTGAFVTAFYGIYDSSEGALTYARAGHNPPLLRQAGQVRQLNDVGGFPLGIETGERYEEGRVALNPGDAIVLYTDGLTEARNASDDMFGVEGMAAILRGHRGTAAEILRASVDAVRRFDGGGPPLDDRTALVALRR
ncbi:MAG: PP2C family protein-serine/threonine phosphatase [Phycisphaeraceae bacterium]|nr:PP2C family protein-serine/threonine phosphatase [Phycisphaeraceae bacterium]